MAITIDDIARHAGSMEEEAVMRDERRVADEGENYAQGEEDQGQDITVTLSNGQIVTVDNYATDEEILDYARATGKADESTTLKQMGTAEGIVTNVIKGATLGYDDEVEAGKNAATTEETYNQSLRRLREDRRNFKNESPWTAGISEFAGGLLPIAKALKYGGLLAKAAAGAAYGAASYLGNLDGEEIDPMTGGIITALSAAAPPLIQGGGKALNALWGTLKGKKTNEVQEILQEMAKKSGLSMAELTDKIRTSDDIEGMFDLLPGTGPAYVKAIVQSGNEKAIQTVKKNISRTDGARQRIRDEIPREKGFHQTAEEISAKAKAQSDELYGPALDAPVKIDQEMHKFMFGNPLMTKVYERVRRQLAEAGETIPELKNLSKEGLPNGRVLQDLKRASSDLMNEMSGKPGFGRLKELHKQLTDGIYGAVPALRKADQVFSGNKNVESALKAGKSDGLNKVNVEDQLFKIAGMSDDAKMAYGKGIESNMHNVLGKSTDDILTGLGNLSSINSRQVLDKVLGSDVSKNVANRIAKEKAMAKTSKEIHSKINTQTQRTANESMSGAPRVSLSIPSKAGIIPAAFKFVTDRLVKRMPGKDIEELAHLLTDPARKADAFKLMRKHGVSKEEASSILAGFSAAMTQAPGAVERNTPEPQQEIPQQEMPELL